MFTIYRVLIFVYFIVLCQAIMFLVVCYGQLYVIKIRVLAKVLCQTTGAGRFMVCFVVLHIKYS